MPAPRARKLVKRTLIVVAAYVRRVSAVILEPVAAQLVKSALLQAIAAAKFVQVARKKHRSVSYYLVAARKGNSV